MHLHQAKGLYSPRPGPPLKGAPSAASGLYHIMSDLRELLYLRRRGKILSLSVNPMLECVIELRSVEEGGGSPAQHHGAVFPSARRAPGLFSGAQVVPNAVNQLLYVIRLLNRHLFGQLGVR